MIADLRRVRTLIHGPILGWIVLAVLGSVLLAGLDTLGVAAMLPLMQLVTGGATDDGVLGWLANALGTSDLQPLILAVAGLVGLAFVLKTIVGIGFRWWLLGKTTKLEAEAATDLVRQYMLSPYAVHRTRNVSEIYRNVNTSVSQAFSHVVLGLLGVMADILTLLAVVAVLTVVSPLATVFSATFFLLIGWGIQRALSARYLKIGTAIAEAELGTWGALMPGLAGFRESRLAGSEKHFVGRFKDARFYRAAANRSLSMVSELPKYILEIGLVVGIAGIAGILFATSSQEQAVAVLGVFAAASVRILPIINRVVATFGIIRTGRTGLELLSEAVSKFNHLARHSSTSVEQHSYSGDIEISNLSFSFEDSEKPVLEDISTVIEEGKTTAFVGSSGAGKSTLLDIVLGLLNPTDGVVTCGGVKIDKDLPGWYDSLGVVPQDIYVLDDTLINNIAFGQASAEIDPVRLEEAVRLAQLDHLVAELPEGLQTNLGERGVRLSGGQRQRVGIARALYRRPNLLVLDEATSALDNATEHKISETIESLRGRMTIVLVAHRLSTVRRADKVIFMSQGRISNEGTFQEVEMMNPEFANLVALGRLT